MVKGEAESEEGLKNEGPVLDGAEDPYDESNLFFEVGEEGNVCPADTSSDGSLLNLGVSLYFLLAFSFSYWLLTPVTICD